MQLLKYCRYSFSLAPDLIFAKHSMKRIIAFILALVYITSTSGAVITTHYCAGKIKSVSVELSIKSCACKAEEPKGCCKTEQKLVKLNDTHKASNVAFNFGLDEYIVPSEHHLTNDIPLVFSNINLQQGNSSPPLLPVAIYIYNCSFLI